MADLRELRGNVAAFAAEVDRPLTSWQARALALEARTTVVVAPRQSGKSRSLSVLATWAAFRRPRQTVLILSAGEEAAKRLLAEVRRLVSGSPLLAGSVTDETAMVVTLSNGSEIRSVPASERQVRGWSVDLLLVDEAAMVSDDLLLGAAFPTTAARPEARIVLASSPLTTAGAFFDHAARGERGDAHVRTFRWALRDAEWIAPSVVEAARASMSPLRFRAEFEGEFVSGADLLFPRSVLERVLADYAPSPLAATVGPAALYVGCDWGWTTDRSAAIGLGRLAGEPRFGVVFAQRWPEAEPGHQVIADLAGAPAHYDLVVSETNGLGAPLTESLFMALRVREARAGAPRPRAAGVMIDAEEFDAHMRRERARRGWVERSARLPTARKLPLYSSSASKAAAYSALRLLVDREQLVIPRAARDLVSELLTLRIDLTPGGRERIEAAAGAHDDLCDALAAALGPLKGRDGQWRTSLAAIAATPAGRLPQPELGAGVDLEQLERDAIGVALTPVWQSIRDARVTVPAFLRVAAVAPAEDRLLTRARAAVRAAHPNNPPTTGGPAP